MPKLFNKYDAPRDTKTYASQQGSDIYEYIDANGDKQKINMQEKIQSYLHQVDYKKRIELGLGLETPLLDDGTYTDTTGLPSSTVDLINLTNAISSLSQEQIANILQQSNQTSPTTDQGGQTITENITTPIQTAPVDSTNIATTNPTGTTEGGQ